MPRLCGLDLESTGLDIGKDKILKLGIALYDTEEAAFIYEKEWTLWHDTYPEISEGAFKAHGIKKKHCIEFGSHPTEVIENLAKWIDEHHIDFLVAHNGLNFDFPMLEYNQEAFCSHLRNFFKNLKKIDTSIDIDYPPHIQTRKLTYLAAEHGFLNPFPHSSLSDVRTMMQILLKYPIEKTIERSKSKTIILQGRVSYDNNYLVKAKGYRWDSTGKRWIKRVKECDLDRELIESSFEISVVRE